MFFENECSLLGYFCNHKATAKECHKYCTCGLMCSYHACITVEPYKVKADVIWANLIDEIVMKCFTAHTFHDIKLASVNNKVLALICNCGTELRATENMLLSEKIILER